MVTLTPELPDPYAPFYQAARRARSARRAAYFLALIVALQAAVIALLALQPPWVIVKDHVNGRAPAITRLQSDPGTTLADARLFFTEMVRLRYAWASGSVARDLDVYLRHCHPAHRAKQLQHLRAAQGPAAANSASPHRLAGWQRAKIINHVNFLGDEQDVHCQLRPDEPVWDCAARAALTVVGEGQEGHAPSAQEEGTFVASLLEVPHTARTPYGLVVAHLDWVNSTAPGLLPSQEVAP